MKKNNLDVFCILLGVIIGILLGFFISSRIEVSSTHEVSSIVDEQSGFIYIVEVAQFDNANGPLNYIRTLNSLGENAIAIKRGDFYYVYTCISASQNEAQKEVDKLTAIGYSPKINKEYILDYTNNLIDENQINFYNYCINCYLSNLNNQSFLIDETYADSQVDVELMQKIIMLNIIKKEDNIKKLRLQIYESLVKIK